MVTVRKVTHVGLDIIKYYEQGPGGGFAATRYKCPAGYWTLGYGHEILPGESFIEPISEDFAEELLRKDLLIAERSVCRLITTTLEDFQYDALVSFTFNLGGFRLQCSTLRMVINRGEHMEAPRQIMRWVYAGRPMKVQPGLVKRRRVEAELYGGDY